MSAITNILTIGETVLPVPTGYTVTRNDLDGSGTQRSESGVLHRDRLRAGIYSIEAEWEGIPVGTLNTLTAALITNAKLTVTFFDLTTGTVQTKQMYAANPSASVSVPGNSTDDMKCSYSVSLVEF